jgi:hypothetical protein
LHNEEPRDFYPSPDSIRVNKKRWSGHGAHERGGGRRNAYKRFVGKTELKQRDYLEKRGFDWRIILK